MHEASDEYMGYAGRAEVLPLLAAMRSALPAPERSDLTGRLRALLPRIREESLRRQVEDILQQP